MMGHLGPKHVGVIGLYNIIVTLCFICWLKLQQLNCNAQSGKCEISMSLWVSSHVLNISPDIALQPNCN